MKRKSSKTSEPNCVVCYQGGFHKSDVKRILDNWNVCKAHKEELEKENKMECKFCSCQDTKYVEGINKDTGKKWMAYECTNKNCVQTEGAFAGKPNRTFVFAPKSGKPKGGFQAPSTPQSNSLEKKIDFIIEILKANFEVPPTTKKPIDDDSTPF